PLGHTGKDEGLFSLAQLQNPGELPRCIAFGIRLQHQRHILSGPIKQADRNGNMIRLLGWLTRAGQAGLAQGQAIRLAGCIIGVAGLDPRRARLAGPELELAEIPPADILHGLDEVITGDRTAIMTLKVEITALAELL